MLFLSCVGSHKSLLDRGIPKEERQFYVIQNGYGISWERQKAFIEGDLQIGMTREMVYSLFGAPDRASRRDSIWDYADGNGNTILSVFFSKTYKDTVVSYTGFPQ